MDAVRIGVVGAGLVAATVHLPLLRELDERFEVVALAEPDRARRERAARRFGIARGYPDHRDLIAAGGLDALLVCSPSGAHAATALDALAAGLHVLVEKPLCLTLEEADAIAAARGGLTVQVGYMKRFDPAYEALLDDLPVALTHVVTTTYDPGLASRFGFPDAPVRDAYADAFLGALVHDVNAVHGVLERLGAPLPLRVLDGGCTAGGRVATGTVELPGGARWTMAWMLLPGVGDFREEIALYADDGARTLTFPAPYLLRAPTAYTRVADGVHRSWGSWDEAYRRQLEHFHRCITTGEPCRTPPEQARADIELLARVYEAATGAGPPPARAAESGRGATSGAAAESGRGATSGAAAESGRGATSGAATESGRGATSGAAAESGRGATSGAATESGRGATSGAAA